jgi:hypothetical protein
MLFDDDDIWILRYSIAIVDNGRGHLRAVFTSGELEGKYVHRVLVSTSKQLTVDHINRNSLDNRKSNLRHVSRYVNASNAGVHKDKADCKLPRGVDRLKTGKYRARITLQGLRLDLGHYKTPEEAAEAYRKYAIVFNTGWHDGTKG